MGKRNVRGAWRAEQRWSSGTSEPCKHMAHALPQCVVPILRRSRMASRDRSTRSASSSMRDMSGGGGSRQMSGGMQSAQSAQSTQSTPSSSSEEEFLPQREERQN